MRDCEKDLLCCGRVGRWPKSGGEHSAVVVSGEWYGFILGFEAAAAAATAATGWRSAIRVFAVFERERSGLRRRNGRAGSGSRKGLFSSPVAVQDCIIDETEEADRRCWAMGVGIRGGASSISGEICILS